VQLVQAGLEQRTQQIAAIQAVQETQIGELQDEIGQLQEENDALRKENERLTLENAELKKRVDALHEQVASLQSDVNTLKGRDHALTVRQVVTTLEKRVLMRVFNNRKADAKRAVSIKAFLAKSTTTPEQRAALAALSVPVELIGRLKKNGNPIAHVDRPLAFQELARLLESDEDDEQDIAEHRQLQDAMAIVGMLTKGQIDLTSPF